MATQRDNTSGTADATLNRVTSTRRALMEYQFVVYSTIVARKHGVPAPIQASQLGEATDSELQSLVESLRDMAHLPPA